MPPSPADIFRQAAEVNRTDPRREGNLLRVGPVGRVLIAGDLHGNANAMMKIVSHAYGDGKNVATLVLQEIIHGPIDPVNSRDGSVDLMLRAARSRIQQPEKVLFLMGNHDLAQLAGNEITKEGRGTCKAFAESVRVQYGDEGEDVLEAVCEFCRSLPLAIRFANGVQASHSLPSPHRQETAGVEILTRETTDEDLHRGGGVYEWTWGRDQSPEQLDALAGELGVDFFVLGHRHTDDGYMLLPPRAVAIDSAAPRGVIFEFDDGDPIDRDNPTQYFRRVASL